MLSVHVGIMDIKVIQLADRFNEEAINQARRQDLNFCISNLEFIKCAANLAHRELIDELECIRLGNTNTLDVTDLSTIPTHHLSSLVASAVGDVYIANVTGCDLVTIINSLQCDVLDIFNQRLGREETKALGVAMKYRVSQVVMLDEVELDVKVLTDEIDVGRVMHRSMDLHLKCESSTDVTYARELRRWADGKGLSYEIHNEKGVFRNDDVVDEEQHEDMMNCKVYSIEINFESRIL